MFVLVHQTQVKKLQKKLKKRETELDKVLTEQENKKDLPPHYKVSSIVRLL